MKRALKVFAVFSILVLGIATTTTDHGKYFEISKNIEIFTNLYKEINTYYVDDVDPAKLMRTGVDAMLASLDPYTNYISESEIEGFRYITDGKYNGIGAMIRKTDDYVTITEPYENCPAQKAGLRAGDVILAVDGKSAQNRSTDDVSDILKGFPGTEVVLTIRRPGVEKPMKITMVRDEVVVPNVPYSGMLNGDIGYIALTTFTRNAGKNVGDALKKLKEENSKLKGVVFDLRGNGGGLLTEAVNVSNVFISKGELVVSTKGKVLDWDRSFKTINKAVDKDIPLVLLIDGNSASASEIVSGVIQDLDRGVLIGQRSYGKGLVQNTRDVGYNSKVKLTTAKYYIPSGRCIQGVSYDDGKPMDIPDEQRTAFKTRNGRKVLDGGGLKPDMLVKNDGGAGIVKSLIEENILFDYVTGYYLKSDKPENVKALEFEGFEDFVAYVQQQDFEYRTESEKILEQLKKQTEKDAYNSIIGTQIAKIEEQIKEEKKNDLSKYKETIIGLIEKEIASRHFYQKGKIQVGLKNDAEIKEAISILNDKARYQSILKQ
ncbi:MAG: S41 family peptidase [Bacteroidota bacterium]